MRTIAIIGAGQSGLQLGFSLIKQGYYVTIFTRRTAEEMLHGPTMPNPGQFFNTLAFEKELGLDFWRNKPNAQLLGGQFTMIGPEGKGLFNIANTLQSPAQVMDLRLKYYTWMNEFKRRGGKIIKRTIDATTLDQIAPLYDLTLVATGRTPIPGLFQERPEFNVAPSPMRHLGLFMTDNMELEDGKEAPIQGKNAIRGFIIPGVAETFNMPIMYRDGSASTSLLVEAVPNGPLDIFDRKRSGTEQLEQYKQIIKQISPEVYHVVKDATLKSEKDWMVGAIKPTVRQAVGTLTSGSHVLGIGDAVVTNDPIMAQGLNSASKMAHVYANKIVEHGMGNFSKEWMQDTFDQYWDSLGRVSYEYNNSFLFPPSEATQKLMFMASQNPAMGKAFFHGLAEPHTMHPVLTNPEAASRFLQGAMAAA